MIQGRRVAAGCHGAQATVHEAVLTCALYDVLVTDAELVAVAATALSALGAGCAIRSTRRSALPAYALLSLIAAVSAAAAVALVCLQVYAPVFAAGLALRAAANLVVSPPNAVLRAALEVPPTFPPQTPAIVGPGHPWQGGQRSS